MAREAEIAKAARAYCERFREAYQRAKLDNEPDEFLFWKAKAGTRPLLLELCKVVFDDDFEFEHAKTRDVVCLPDPAHRCAVCGVNWVDSDNGFDTCGSCLASR